MKYRVCPFGKKLQAKIQISRSVRRLVIKSILLSLILIVISCGRDEDIFKKAEKHYNQQEFELALDQYKKLIEEYPTSQWREISEKRFNELRECYELINEAREYEHNKLFAKAFVNYKRLKRINTDVYDKYESHMDSISDSALYEVMSWSDSSSNYLEYASATIVGYEYFIAEAKKWYLLEESSGFKRAVGRLTEEFHKGIKARGLKSELITKYKNISEAPLRRLELINSSIAIIHQNILECWYFFENPNKYSGYELINGLSKRVQDSKFLIHDINDDLKTLARELNKTKLEDWEK